MASRSSTHPYELFASNYGHAPKQHKKGEREARNAYERLDCKPERKRSGVRFEFNWPTTRLEAVMKLADP